MSKLTPVEFAEKHARRLKASSEDIRKGVARVTEAPTAKAAAKADKMLAKITEAVTSGKWADRLRAVSLEEWQAKMTTKGIPRISAGIDAARAKVEDFYAQMGPFQDTLQRKIETMPDMTIEDSIARASEWMRGMAKFSKK